MMNTSQTVPDLITQAQAQAKAPEDVISTLRNDLNGQSPSKAQADDLRAAKIELERTAVDIFSLFEARMQHHFKRGPFSRKLKAALLDAGHTDLADRFHKYYLAMNVLKHGTGASHRELLDMTTKLFHVQRANNETPQDAPAPSPLIDIGVSGFFDGFTATLLEAYQFLEKK